MADLENRLRQLVRAGDPDGTVTLTIRFIAELIGEPLQEQEREGARVPARDLTVDEVAAHFRRSPSTVRGWLGRSELRGYKINHRDWRVPRPALAEYEEAQRNGQVMETEEVDIGEWRKG